MAWIRANTPGDAVVLEAFGDDYSAFGHARISTFTGPADRDRLGGPRAAVGPRPRDARRRRQDDVHGHVADAGAAAADKYGVGYVVVGPIEQTTYGDAGPPSGTSWAGGSIRAKARRSGSSGVRAA